MVSATAITLNQTGNPLNGIVLASRRHDLIGGTADIFPAFNALQSVLKSGGILRIRADNPCNPDN